MRSFAIFQSTALRVLAGVLFGAATHSGVSANELWVTYEGKPGLPGNGTKVLLVSGDEEYRSEEAMPQLGKILSQRHGFDCTVLFAIDPESGTIDPNNQTNIPGLEALDSADMLILFTRFRELPDADAERFERYLNSGRPIFGLRTSTHPFHYTRNKESRFAKWDWKNEGPEWRGGFGQEVFGETWIRHHGKHKVESTRGVINPELADHPILNGVEDLWGPSDVYGIDNLGDDAKILVHGHVLTGMEPADQPVTDGRNDDPEPIVWIRDYKGQTGNTSKIIMSTFFSAIDMECTDLRRLAVNTVFWATGHAVPEKANVDPVGEFKPSFYGFEREKGYWKGKGMRPSDFKLEQKD